MTERFWPGGGQELHPGSRWIVPGGDTAREFKDVASGNLGFVTEQTNIPNVFNAIGCGLLNMAEFTCHLKTHKPPTGAFSVDAPVAKNFRAGVEAALSYDEQGQGLIYQHALAIGDNVYKSIAPVEQPFARRRRPPKPAGHAISHDFLALDHFNLAHDFTASTARNTSSDLLREIGEHVFRNGGNAMVTDRLMPQAQASAPSGKLKDAAKLTHGIAPYLQLADDIIMPYSLAGRMFSGAPQHETFTRDDTPPSLAPKSLQGSLRNSQQTMTLPNRHGYAENETARRTIAPRDVKHLPSQTQVKRALDALLNQQARLPPAGPTGFDPSLTPFWAGLKLPH